MNCKIFVFITLAFFTAPVYAQSYYARHYQVENGLSNNAVICSLIDKKGFLWFGTKDGLNRFDGYSFKVFRNDPDNPHSLGNNFIHCLYEDQHGLIWIGTENGLFTYDASTESFTLFDSTSGGVIRDILLDKKDNLWYITGLTLFRYNKKQKINKGYATNVYFEATSLSLSAQDDIWVSTTSGFINQYNYVTDNFASFSVFSHSPGAVSKWIEKIQCTDTSILIGTSTQGAKIFNRLTNTYKDILTYNADNTEIFVRNFVLTNNHECWIATESGIYIYNLATGQTANLGKKYNDAYSISDNAVYTFCKDKEGGIWAGTYFGGINYYPKEYSPFKKYFPKIGENSINGNVIREIREDQYGSLWIGTEDAGLNKLNKHTGIFTHYQPGGNGGHISYTNIHGLLASHNELWIGTFEHGLDVLDIPTGKVIRHYQEGPDQPELKSNFFYCIYQTTSHEILFGTAKGAYYFNRTTNQIKLLTGLPQGVWYTSLLKTKEGIIWASTYGNGINYYNTITQQRQNFRYHPQQTNSICSDRVNSLFEDSQGSLWFATEGGLCKYNKTTNDFKSYTTKNGLPGNYILSILEDDQKHLWISTTKGLVWFDLITEASTVFTADNGLLNNQFNFSSAYKDVSGTMYFGSAKGLISFQPKDIVKNSFTPPVYLTGFQVNNKELPIAKQQSILQKSITETQQITLPYNESTFSIDFAALSYTAPSMLEYAYKLNGLDAEWTYLKTNRKVYFTNLSPGTYVFKVKASNVSGVWNTTETTLTIIILSPWWATWWAYAAYGLAILLLGFMVIKNYHQATERKNKRKIELLEIAKEKEIFEAKIEFFTNVAHEIRTPLTLIKGPLEKVMKKAGDIPELKNSLHIMDKNTERLISLTSQLLDFRQTEIQGFSLSFVPVNISELLEETHLNFKPLAEQKNIAYTISLPRKPVIAYVDLEALNKIFYNLFSNAVKYADAEVAIILSPVAEGDKVFSVEIKNDGYLIPMEMKDKIFQPFFRLKETEKRKGTGIGLAISRSLAELHKGSLELKEPNQNLNIFWLRLPIHQDNEFDLPTGKN